MGSKHDYRRPYCEICGAQGGCYTPDGWRTCSAHLRAQKPEHPLFDYVTGEPIPPEAGRPVVHQEAGTRRPSATNAGSYANRFCEVCGVRCGGVSRGWSVCNAHVGVELPDWPVFDAQSGARLRGES